MSDRTDIAVVGAGMAGASIAAMLAPHASVTLLEAEDQPGYHATGRSAAFWEETYGGPGVYPFTAASGPYLRDHGFLNARGAIIIGQESDRPRVNRFVDRFAALGVDISLLERDGLSERVPGLREQWTCGAWEPTCCDIDVAGLHAHFLALGAAGGVALRSRAGLVSAQRSAGRWLLDLADGSRLSADVVVNAAGAWTDQVAKEMGAGTIGIVPLRRTMAQVRVQPAVAANMPLVLGINEDFYFKPESGRLWLSPHDETLSEPCDAAPEEWDVAVAIDRLEAAVDWKVEAVERKWAGLRSFAPDRLPVYGFDVNAPGLFWCAGQGGFGIQTAPAAAALAAGLLLGRGVSDLADAIDPAAYAPDRFA